MLLVSSGPLRQNSDASLFHGMLSYTAAGEAGQLPQWLLQVLSQDERTGLLRLSIFPLAFTLDMATSVLPSICKLTIFDFTMFERCILLPSCFLNSAGKRGTNRIHAILHCMAATCA